MLKTERWTVAWYKDFNDLVEETYGVSFSVQQEFMLGNGSIISIDAVDEVDLESMDPIEDVGDFYESLSEFGMEGITVDLARRGLIPTEGFHLHVWW